MIEQTMDRMKSLRLPGMQSAYEVLVHDKKIIKMTNDEMLMYLVDAEYEDRKEKRVSRLTKKANFKILAALGEVDTSTSRGFEKQTLMRLSNLNWLRHAENILITGATGSGKTFITNAIGHTACIGGFTVGYFMVGKLLRKHKEAEVEMTASKLLRALEKTQLLILDDFGLDPLNKAACRVLFEIIDDRYGKTSTIISSQLPIKLWSKVFEDKTIADAILDRLIHNAHKIELATEKESRRKKKMVAK
jgi:DNA replication protein DnaC